MLVLGGQEVLSPPDDWTTKANVIREAGRKKESGQEDVVME